MIQALRLPHALRPIRRTGFFGMLRTVLNGYSHGLLVEKDLASQLRKRDPEEVEEMWKGNSLPVSIRKDICGIIRKGKCWPNDCFVPSDRMEYLLTTHWGDLDINEIYDEIERRYAIQNLDLCMDIDSQTLDEFLRCVEASRGKSVQNLGRSCE